MKKRKTGLLLTLTLVIAMTLSINAVDFADDYVYYPPSVGIVALGGYGGGGEDPPP